MIVFFDYIYKEEFNIVFEVLLYYGKIIWIDKVIVKVFREFMIRSFLEVLIMVLLIWVVFL